MTEGTRATPDVFDQRVEEWAAWQDTPWGRLRYRLVAHTLAGALRRLPHPCRVLDAGGADGRDSLALAEKGHLVTILDHSHALLDRARARAAAAGVGHLVRTVHAEVTEASAVAASAGEPCFDLVLCHNVLHYLADPRAAVAALVAATRPGGMLSLLAPNPAMDALAAAVRRTSPADALALLNTRTVRSETFQHDMRRLEAATVAAQLDASSCVITDRFGIRCVTDLIADDEIKHQPAFFADLEQLELALCDHEPYVRVARFWQLLAVRQP